MSFSINRQVTFFICLVCVLFFALRVRAENLPVQVQKQIDSATCTSYKAKLNVQGYKFDIGPTVPTKLPDSVGLSRKLKIQIGDLQFIPFQVPSSGALGLTKVTHDEKRLKQRKEQNMRPLQNEISLFALGPNGDSQRREYYIRQTVGFSQSAQNVPTNYGRVLTIKKMSDYSNNIGYGGSATLEVKSGLDVAGEDELILDFSKANPEKKITVDGMPGGVAMEQKRYVITKAQIQGLYAAPTQAEINSCKAAKGQRPTVAPRGRSVAPAKAKAGK